MRKTRIFWLLAVLISATPAWGQAAKSAAATPEAQQQPPPTIASTVDREITAVEKLLVDAAEAMPEDEFNFSPESLNIPGSQYKGVRTFAVQVKHVAASNYFIWSPLTGDNLPEGLKDGNGPQSLKTKSDIIKFLKDSFALGHKAAATLTTENMLQPPGAKQIHAPAPGYIRRRSRLRSLRADGGVLAHERHRPPSQPCAVRLIARRGRPGPYRAPGSTVSHKTPHPACPIFIASIGLPVTASAHLMLVRFDCFPLQ